ncbi:MAG: hypothetical protein AAFU79_26170 [Myxococcota bacterium]
MLARFAFLCSLTLLALVFATYGGCTSDACSVDPRAPDEPVSAIECGSGDLCYRGRCVSTCTAGQEASASCESDGDCDSARPRCLNGFCSACDQGEECIPVLDICEAVSEVPLPEVPEIPPVGAPRPPGPRDAGTLGAGLIPPGDDRPDAGQVVLPLTRTVFIDLSRTEILAGPGRDGDALEVLSYDVSNNPAGLVWRGDRIPPAIEETVQEATDCDLNAFRAPDEPPTPADFGTIRVADFNGSGALSGELVATWDPLSEAYTVAPSPLPQPSIVLSTLTPPDSTFVTITGSRVDDVTDSTWPASELGLHVPFDLTLDPATVTLLSGPITREAAGPVSVGFEVLFERVGTGVVPSERIVLRIPGLNHEILCPQPEGPGTDNRIALGAALLEQFRNLEMAPVGAAYPVILERASAERFSVVPDAAQPELRFFVSARVRHSYQGLLVFQ